MRVQRISGSTHDRLSVELRDDNDEPIPVVTAFLRHLQARDYSPNTLSAYAHDLLHFFRFLGQHGLDYQAFTPATSLSLLEYLRALPSRDQTQRRSRLSPASVNRILAAVSSFYEYLIVSDHLCQVENPMRRVDDLATALTADRHRPFLGRAARLHPVRRVVRVRTAHRLPHPLPAEQVSALLASLHRLRDRAMVLLMLQGGLRPGEVLNLHLEDIQYGRRRVLVRYRTDHPKGVRTKSRQERVVDLYEPEALATVSAYVQQERPADTANPHVFLIGGHGTKRHEPLGYQGLVRLFSRHCARLGIRAPWVTPHALRHTHATRMWEGGMRELTLQKRLGHASPESTRLYTRVSDATMVADYVRALGRGLEGDEP